jgi:hypothetical protein
MFTNLKKAYNAGQRAGRAEPRLVIINSQGIRHIVPIEVICPFQKKRQFLLRAAYLSGWEKGLKKRLTDFLNSRKGYEHAA